MSAGGSQAVSAVRAALDTTWAAKRSRRHLAGCRGERQVCAELSRLAPSGFEHLDDLRWRADLDSRVNLDHLVVGPTGVYVVDAKNWAGRIEVRGNHVLQDGRYVDDRLIALSWLRLRVAEVLRAAGYAHVPQALVCFTGSQPQLPGAVAGVLLTDRVRLAATIERRPHLLGPAQVRAITELLAYAFPPYDLDARELAEAEGLLFADVETRHAGMQAALEAPIEDWMVWLHPEQASCVRRTFAGPARIRGSAGTGKSSVALHRVAWLASTRPGRFLVTSYVKTLPAVLACGYARLAPQTVNRIDFVHLHRVALDLLAARGVPVRADAGHAAFAVAWADHRDALAGTGLTKGYFREEVDAVLKGRDLTSLAQYLRLDRVGRGTPLQSAVRRAVWSLREHYDAELRRRGQHDFVDVLRMARDQARRTAYGMWQGVVVDEVQDVPMVGLQLLYELAGRDRPDGLLLLGDGQQAVYPGGFRLAEAGLSVAGRSVVLTTNYRNTVEILAAAGSVVREDGYDDVDVSAAGGDRRVEVVRHGARPTIEAYDDVSAHDAALLWDVQALADRGIEWSRLAVLCPTNTMAKRYAEVLVSHGIPVSMLTDGPAGDAVSVGTWFRSKGLEWPHVFLPQSDRETMLLTGAGVAARAEKAALLRRTLYVAMTRARDTLWVGTVRAAPARVCLKPVVATA